jgi:hypothetical protein
LFKEKVQLHNMQCTIHEMVILIMKKISILNVDIPNKATDIV